MPKKVWDEYEDRCRRLWFAAHGADPERSIEDIYDKVLFEEFEGRVHEFRIDPRKSWPEKQRVSLSWFTKRIRDTWPKGELSPDKIIRPWDESWGNDPVRIRTLSVLSDVARDVCKRKESEYPGLEFQGFTDRVCNWACKLSAFFDLTLRHECLVLIHFGHTFAEDERYAKVMKTTLPLDSGSPFMLMRWHHRNQEPEVTVVDTPPTTERPWRGSATWRYTWRDEKVMEDVVALHISRQTGVDIVSATGVITKQSAGGE